MTPRERYRHLVSLLEVPILNPKYWSKVPHVDADAILMDLEDSAPSDAKDEVRQRVAETLRQPAFFGGRQMAVRVNNLATRWGVQDLEMLAASDADVLVCYPKAQTANELHEVCRLVRKGRPDRELWAMIETPSGVMNLDAICRTEGLAGLHFGYTDFAAEMGVSAFDPAGEALAPAMAHAAHSIAIAAAAFGLFATGGSMVPQYRDIAKVERFLRGWAEAGYTACLALSPSHLPIVDRAFRPSAEDKAAAESLCAAFEAAAASGAANVMVEGRIVTLPEYKRLQALLARARD